MTESRHHCEYWWPLAALFVGFLYGNVARYVARTNEMPADAAALYTALFIYFVSCLAVACLWLVPAAQRSIESLLLKTGLAGARVVCVRQALGFAFVNAVFVYGLFATVVTKNVRYYMIAALVAAAVSLMALIRAAILPTRLTTRT